MRRPPSSTCCGSSFLAWTGSSRALGEESRAFDGADPISWINQMELYMSRPGAPEHDKLSIALSYLDAEALDWLCPAA